VADDAYSLIEWQGFLDDPSRARATLAAVANRDVQRVLDVGCGAGQELIPFAQRGALAVGVDVSSRVGAGPWRPEHGTACFVRGAAERLPFAPDSFDVLVCRGALGYMNARAVLREMARVLRPGGLLLLKLSAAPVYVREFRQGLATRNIGRVIHGAHGLVGGAIYHVFGTQVPRPFLTCAFLSERLIRRELQPIGMSIVMRMPDSDRLGPHFGIVKGAYPCR
jgi:SAM-dependent methyltransferase